MASDGMWELVALENVVVPTERRDPTKSPNDPFVYVDIGSVDSTTGAIVNLKKLQGREAPSRARKVIRSDDVIFATTRPYLRNIALVPNRYDDQICSTGFCVLRADREALEPSFLYYLCRSDVVLDQVLPRMRGASYPAVTDTDILTSKVPLPPLDEQRRIVARIEELFEHMAEARRLRVAADEDTARLLDAAVDKVMSMLPSERVPLVKVLSEKPRTGWSPKGDDNVEGVPVLKLGAVLRFWYDSTAVKFTKAPTHEDAHYWLKPGDLLISRSNTPNLVGHAAIYNGTPHPCIYPDLLMRMRVDEKRADPRFVVFWLRSPETRHFIGQRARGASSTMKKISQGDVGGIPFPQVPLSEQRRIVEYLDGVQSQVAELKRLLAASAAELERLGGAVLARAFKGEL